MIYLLFLWFDINNSQKCSRKFMACQNNRRHGSTGVIQFYDKFSVDLVITGG